MFTDLVAIDGSNFRERNIWSQTLQNIVVRERGESCVEKCTITLSNMRNARLFARLCVLCRLFAGLARSAILVLGHSCRCKHWHFVQRVQARSRLAQDRIGIQILRAEKRVPRTMNVVFEWLLVTVRIAGQTSWHPRHRTVHIRYRVEVSLH